MNKDKTDIAVADDFFGSVEPLKEILNGIPVAVVVTDNNGVFRFANDEYFASTSISPEDVIGREVGEIEKEGVLFKESYALQALESKKPVSGVSLYNSHGNHKAGVVRSIPVMDDRNNVKFVVTTILDSYDLRRGFKEFKHALKNKDKDNVQIIGNSSELNAETLIGDGEQMKIIKRQIDKVAKTNALVLITGESGCGKEVVADCIYNNSERKGKPFVKINCTAIPKELLETELFGYEKGAFTGATSTGKIGLLEAANHGTVLLDEIGDFPLSLQPKLLRVLQQGSIYRIGSNQPIQLDVRFLAATNSDLRAKVADGSFRSDLYYRLAVFPIKVPPLRERTEDITALAEFFLDQYSKQYKKMVVATSAAMRAFQQYSWPGNVRELENVLEYLVICSDSDTAIRAQDVRNLLFEGKSDAVMEGIGISTGTLFEQRDAFEKRLISETILRTGSVRETARQLGIYVSSLYRKIEKYNINTDDLIKQFKNR